MTTDLYCAKIFKGLYVEKFTDGEARIAACNLNEIHDRVSVIDFYNDKNLSNQRHQVNNNTRPESCNRCWEQEDAGLPSARTNTNQHFRFSSANREDVELLSIDYNVPPLCNGKCIMCSAEFSSAWAAEDAQHGKQSIRAFNEVRKSTIHTTIDYANVQRIYFNGGEPLLSDEVEEVLLLIKEQKGSLSDVDITISTNASILPSKRLQSAWQGARSVTIIASVDAVGKAFEYIRYPLSWESVKSNIVELASNARSYGITGMSINNAIGLHNILEFQEFINWFNDLRTHFPIVSYLDLQPTMGTLSLKNLSAATTVDVLNLLPSDQWKETFSAWCNLTNTSQTDTDWMYYLKYIDDRRGLSQTDSLNISKLVKK